MKHFAKILLLAAFVANAQSAVLRVPEDYPDIQSAIDQQGSADRKLEFQYRAADINLASQSMEWYTLSNNKAMFQGVGTINGVGTYTFRVHATDGDKTGQADHFDIVIWAGTDTESDPIHRAKNELTGGNIVVHKK